MTHIKLGDIVQLMFVPEQLKNGTAGICGKITRILLPEYEIKCDDGKTRYVNWSELKCVKQETYDSWKCNGVDTASGHTKLAYER